MRIQLEQGETNDTVRYAMHHGITYQCVHYDEMLHVAKTFLREHPTETLLFRVKKEGDSKYPPTVSFEDAMERLYDSEEFANLFYLGTTTPTLSEVRGKIVLLRNYSSQKKRGIYFSSLPMQDYFSLMEKGDMQRKFEYITDFL